MTLLVTALAGLLGVGSALTLTLSGRELSVHTMPGRVAAAGCAGILLVLGLLVVAAGHVTGPDTAAARLLVLELFLTAAAGGGPVTATVLWLVDRGSNRSDSLDRAGDVLRGGVWIGVFERAAVFAALASGWPEGLAVVLALKGLGRYSELRGSPGTTTGTTVDPAPLRATGGVAERFIIGSFASVLWACACAGAYLTLAS